MEKESNTVRLSALEKRMTDSENRERLESRELIEVATEMRAIKKVTSDMDGKLDTALEYIAEQRGKELQNKAFYSIGGGTLGAIVSYYLTKWGGGNGGG